MNASVEALNPPGPRQDQIALKYLEIARAEILDRMKSSNQTLTLYVGGIGAIVGWMFQVTTVAQKPVPLRSVVFPMGVVVGFLAFAASWIIFHNERMVNALARYQKKELAPYLHSVLPVTGWESSDQLHGTDNKVPIYITMLVQAAILIGPVFVFLVGMLYNGAHWCMPNTTGQWAGFAIALALAIMSSVLSSYTITQRRVLRGEKR
jgi:hypothetical protein